jgi:uncharacterized protein YcbX
MSEITVSSLHVYPIKSAGGIELDEAEVVSTGLRYDRMFMLIDENNLAITQRTKDIGPKLVGIQPYFPDKDYRGRMGVRLNSDYPPEAGYNDRSTQLWLPLFIPYKNEADLQRRSVVTMLHGKEVLGLPMSDFVNEKLSEYLGAHVRLVRPLPGVRRLISEVGQRPKASNQTAFADGYSMLLTSQKSLEELSQAPQLQAGYPDGLPMERFRPNIVINGEDLKAYDEDYWRFVRFAGNLGAHVVKPCDRCPIPDTDQKTGKIGKEVRQALAQTRKGISVVADSKGVFFGQNLNHTGPGNVLKVGAPLTVIERASEPNVILSGTPLRELEPVVE